MKEYLLKGHMSKFETDKIITYSKYSVEQRMTIAKVIVSNIGNQTCRRYPLRFYDVSLLF